MQYREKYISPYRTVQLIERQAGSPENVAFAKANFSNIKSGAQMWHAVKPLVTFKKDPPTVETIQGITSFFNPKANIHSLAGYGDCDCFTSVCASIAKANNLPYNYIMQGNGKPSHIAIEVANYVVDLTNDQPNYLRPYQTTQKIKPMYVQLNDEPAYELSDFGRGGQGKAKVKTFAKKYGKVIVPAAAIGASLLIPGSGKVVQVAAKKVPGLLAKGAKLISTNKAVVNTAKGFISNKIAGAINPTNLPSAPMPVAKAMQPSGSSDNLPIYETEAVTVTAQKPINPLFIVGGLALAYFLFTKKK